ncbi:hypothetical protein [Clostridium tarantellae]|uniref:DUF3899 domain-containing protein n=1 Tax=Clostridium tarantellae TaxID=39493 RepID=A0A6I1MK59_9CLOT|nr:hypothetical protein [Clostridium tarantellae]MPQ43916.1 hypothetical protein [Clostridium tarantellae]
MNNIKTKTLIKCILFGILWFILLFIIALIILKLTNYALNDILFIEGILFIIIGVLSSLGGNTMSLSLQSMGETNSQYISNANLEITKLEKEKTKGTLKNFFSTSISMLSFVIAGILCIVVNFII